MFRIVYIFIAICNLRVWLFLLVSAAYFDRIPLVFKVGPLVLPFLLLYFLNMRGIPRGGKYYILVGKTRNFGFGLFSGK